MKTKIKIHFVCRGNIYRSRLAEAYARSLKHADWEITSSGIDEDRVKDRMLSPWAKIAGHQQGFGDWFSDTSHQTTSETLQQQDIIIFMRDDVYQDALERYNFNKDKSLVWDIKDRGDWSKDLRIGQMRRRAYKHIKQDVLRLIPAIEHGGWVDIVDSNNKDLGFKLPITITNQKGLWHRCCHALVTTPSKHTLIQKRSKHIMFSPGLIDVSLGGHLDAGEDPETAMVREIDEEVGIALKPEDLKLQFIYKYATYHPRYKRYTKSFTYSYHIEISHDKPLLVVQKSEVSSARFISQRQLRRLLVRHRVPGIGRLNKTYQYYRKTVDLAGIL